MQGTCILTNRCTPQFWIFFLLLLPIKAVGHLWGAELTSLETVKGSVPENHGKEAASLVEHKSVDEVQQHHPAQKDFQNEERWHLDQGSH